MDDRQRLIVRQNALTNATNLFIKLLDVDEGLRVLDQQEIHSMIRSVVSMNEAWVFRDTNDAEMNDIIVNDKNKVEKPFVKVD